MAQARPLYIGPRLRRLRRELGLTQQAMGDDLAISPSYIALLERNQRPITAELLLRLARTFKVDVADLAHDDGADIARRIGDALRDPLFTGIDLPPLEVADLAASFPGISEALLRLHGAYLREQQALADQGLPDRESDAPEPVAEVRRFLAMHGNHFAALDAAAEALAARIDEAGGMAEWLAARGVRVRFLPGDVLMGSIRRFDRHSEQLLIDETLDAASRAFQQAVHIAYVALRGEIAEPVRAAGLRGRSAMNLARRALASYAAAAIVMPYDRFARAVEARRYDIEALARQFGASFEQVAHRLTTLGRDGESVRFALLRIDEAGNASKRLDGADYPFAAQGGCPLWTVHATFRRPREVLTQWLAMPDGRRFFSVARTVRAGGGRFGQSTVTRALALICAAEDASRLVYADSAQPEPTPIGVTCRLCQRAACAARAVPPIGREVIADDNRRGIEPFVFAPD